MKDKFYLNELSNSYIGEIQILNQKVEFEIILNELELNWIEIEQFAGGLLDDHFTKMIETSNKLLLEFIKLVPFGVNEPFNAYDFRLETIIYYGKVDNRIFSGLVDGFELVYKLYHSDHAECYSPNVNYIVRVENKLIVGIRYCI